MDNPPKYIGALYDISDVSLEYRNLAEKDEEVGRILLAKGEYKHAVYLFIQAMEKQVRHKIYFHINPLKQEFRDGTKTHNLDMLIDFLLRILNSKPQIQNQVRDQIYKNVLGGIRFGKLHNDLRYPIYFYSRDSFSGLRIDKSDAEEALRILDNLKLYLKDIDKIRGI
jgi:hypothetical protein